MTLENLRYRLGTGVRAPTLEASLAWLAEHDFHHTDFNADHGQNVLTAWSDERVRGVRALLDKHDIHLGIHTLSGLNVAEFSPYVSEAVDAYLRANIDLGKRLGVERVIVHAGFHQSSELEQREQASLQHLQAAVAYAESAGVVLLLENLNVEPDDAEMHYMGFSTAELQKYFSAIDSPNFGWGFSANHTHLLPEDFDGFIDALGIERMGLVLTADNRGRFEEHLPPGQGTLDFARLFSRLDQAGYTGPFMLTFGTPDEKLAGRDYLLRQAGVLPETPGAERG
jgi:sugar phosphate isomerase/epimerase